MSKITTINNKICKNCGKQFITTTTVLKSDAATVTMGDNGSGDYRISGLCDLCVKKVMDSLWEQNKDDKNNNLEPNKCFWAENNICDDEKNNKCPVNCTCNPTNKISGEVLQTEYLKEISKINDKWKVKFSEM